MSRKCDLIGTVGAATLLILLCCELVLSKPTKCYITGDRGNGSICQTNFNYTDKHLEIVDCVEDRGIETVPHCFLGYTNAKVVYMEMKGLRAHKSVCFQDNTNRCRDGEFIIDLMLKDLDDDTGQEMGIPIFTDLSMMLNPLRKFTLQNATLSGTSLKKIIHMNTRHFSHIHLQDINTRSSPILTDTFDLVYKNLNKLDIIDSSFRGIETKAFQLGHQNVDVKFANINSLGGTFDPEAFLFTDCVDKSQTNLKIIDSRLKSSSLSIGTISIDYKCKNQFINLHLKNNDFGRVLPKFVEHKKIILESLSKLTLKADPIDCCLESNLWLFQFEETNKKNRGRIDISCLDLDKDVADFVDQEAIKAACHEGEVYNIMSTIIVSILAVVLLLAAFIFMCFYYVLPKKNEGLAISSIGGRTRTTLGSSVISKSIPEVQSDASIVKVESKRSKQMEKVGSKLALKKLHSPSKSPQKRTFNRHEQNH